MSNQPTRIVYIGGYERSGTTLLSNLLNAVDGMTTVGEFYHLFGRGIHDNITCGCGTPFLDCPYWSRVLSLCPISTDRAKHIAQVLRGMTNRHLPLWGSRAPRRRAEYGALDAPLLQLYRAVIEASANQVIVDASKLPGYAAYLADQPDIQMFLLHVTRDPRGVEFSKYKRAANGHPYYANHHTTVRSAIAWRGHVHNLL